MLDLLRDRLQEWTGERWMIALSEGGGEPTLEEQDRAAQEAADRAAMDHPLVRQVLDAFPGARVRKVHRTTTPLRAGRRKRRRLFLMKNIGKMLKQAQAMQTKMAELQESLGTLEIEGTAGGGLVRVTLTGKGEMRRLSIDPALVKDDEVEVLEDLIVAAFNDGKARVEQLVQERMAEVTGGLKLPPGLDLGL